MKTTTAAALIVAAAFTAATATAASAATTGHARYHAVTSASEPGYSLTTTGADYSRLYLARTTKTAGQDFTAEPAQDGAVTLEWTPGGRETGLVATVEGTRVVLALADMNDPQNQWKVRGRQLVSEAGGVLTASGIRVTVAKPGKGDTWVIR